MTAVLDSSHFYTCPVSMEQACQNLQAYKCSKIIILHTVNCSVAEEVGCSASAVLTSVSVAGSVEDMKPGMEMELQ